MNNHYYLVFFFFVALRLLQMVSQLVIKDPGEGVACRWKCCRLKGITVSLPIASTAFVIYCLILFLHKLASCTFFTVFFVTFGNWYNFHMHLQIFLDFKFSGQSSSLCVYDIA